MKISLFILAILCTLSCRQQNKTTAAIASLPEFKFILPDSSTIINSSSLAKGTKRVFVYFQPGCEHCQEELRMIESNQGLFANIQFIFLTGDKFKDMVGFSKYLKVSNYKNIIVGQDYQLTFYKLYNPPAVPFIAIYDESNKLIKLYPEGVGIDVLKSAVNI